MLDLDYIISHGPVRDEREDRHDEDTVYPWRIVAAKHGVKSIEGA